jgi:hypothetical protein
VLRRLSADSPVLARRVDRQLRLSATHICCALVFEPDADAGANIHGCQGEGIEYVVLQTDVISKGYLRMCRSPPCISRH